MFSQRVPEDGDPTMRFVSKWERRMCCKLDTVLRKLRRHIGLRTHDIDLEQKSRAPKHFVDEPFRRLLTYLEGFGRRLISMCVLRFWAPAGRLTETSCQLGTGLECCWLCNLTKPCRAIIAKPTSAAAKTVSVAAVTLPSCPAVMQDKRVE
jgi:hypothetical protein